MPITKKYSLFAVHFDDVADVFIRGIQSASLNLGLQVDVEVSDGLVYPEWYGISGVAPSARFGTRHIATGLTNIGLEGMSIAGLATGLKLWLQKHADAASRAGASSHRNFNVTKGMLLPRTLTCASGPNQHAELALEAIPTWDGTNAPVTLSGDTETLPSLSGEAEDERFTLGPMKIESITLPEVRTFEIDFGLNAVPEYDSGELYPSFISNETISPVIRLRGIDPTWLASGAIPLTGKIATFANTSFYLRKRVKGGSFVADGIAQHIKFTTGGGLAYIEEAFVGSGEGGGVETSLVFPLVSDQTNAPLIVNTAIAIT